MWYIAIEIGICDAFFWENISKIAICCWNVIIAVVRMCLFGKNCIVWVLRIVVGLGFSSMECVCDIWNVVISI